MWDWIINKSKYLMLFKEVLELLWKTADLCQKVVNAVEDDGQITADEYPELLARLQAMASEAKDVVREASKLKKTKEVVDSIVYSW